MTETEYNPDDYVHADTDAALTALGFTDPAEDAYFGDGGEWVVIPLRAFLAARIEYDRERDREFVTWLLGNTDDPDAPDHMALEEWVHTRPTTEGFDWDSCYVNGFTVTPNDAHVLQAFGVRFFEIGAESYLGLWAANDSHGGPESRPVIFKMSEKALGDAGALHQLDDVTIFCNTCDTSWASGTRANPLKFVVEDEHNPHELEEKELNVSDFWTYDAEGETDSVPRCPVDSAALNVSMAEPV